MTDHILGAVIGLFVLFVVALSVHGVAKGVAWLLGQCFPEAAAALDDALAGELRQQSPTTVAWRALVFIVTAPGNAWAQRAAERERPTGQTVYAPAVHVTVVVGTATLRMQPPTMTAYGTVGAAGTCTGEATAGPSDPAAESPPSANE